MIGWLRCLMWWSLGGLVLECNELLAIGRGYTCSLKKKLKTIQKVDLAGIKRKHYE